MIRQPPSPIVSPAQTPTAIEERFAELTAQFDVLRAQVRQAQQLATLGTAAATLAHEVNNLLTPIRAYAEYAVDSNDTELMKKALKVTTKNVQILIAMTARMLEISAAKAQRREMTDVRRVVDDAVASLCRDFSKDGIKLTIAVDEQLTAFVDPLQLQQVLFNLLLNAREAMVGKHDGRLSVSAARRDDRVIIEVRNTGDPIAPELLPHLFEPFQSSKPSQRDGRQRCGGLGLALCRDLIEENGGSIEVTSGAAGPTTFTISLPATDRPQPNDG